MTKQIDLASLSRDCVGVHWKSLQDLLPIYRAITTTTIGDGCRTSFWLDHWLPTGQLADTFPALFTHAKEPDASVAKVCSQPLMGHFAYRLSHSYCRTCNAGKDSGRSGATRYAGLQEMSPG